MKKSGQALGNVTRQANKKLRRERIFNLAKRLIAAKGLEDFTIVNLPMRLGLLRQRFTTYSGKKVTSLES
jgi:protein required for attachment to host cells